MHICKTQLSVLKRVLAVGQRYTTTIVVFWLENQQKTQTWTSEPVNLDSPPGQYHILTSETSMALTADALCNARIGGYAARIKDAHELEMLSQYLKVT
jgi:hypothetical protein